MFRQVAKLAGLLALSCALVLGAPSPASAQDRDCSDFDTQADAQDFFEQAGSGDPYGTSVSSSSPAPLRGHGFVRTRHLAVAIEAIGENRTLDVQG